MNEKPTNEREQPEARSDAQVGHNAADVEANFKWMPPKAVQNVCTQANVDALRALFDASPTGVKFTDMKTAMGMACTACVFSPQESANWQVFVDTKTAGAAIDNRSGSCYAQVGGEACGKAAFNYERCLDAVCTEEDCGGTAGLSKCYTAARGAKGACKALFDAVPTACPNIADLEPFCDNIYKTITTSCSGGADGGVDAGE